MAQGPVGQKELLTFILMGREALECSEQGSGVV